MNLIKHKIILDDKFYNNKSYNSLRRAKLILFSSLFCDYEEYLTLSTDEKNNIIKILERYCYNNTIEEAHKNNIIASWTDENFCNLYSSICAKISFNIEKGGIVNNPNIAKYILTNKIQISTLPSLSSVDLFPEKYEKIKKRIELSKSISQSVKTSASYTCRKCKKSECILENLYNRSLDEGVNLSIQCINCLHKWTG
jgi:DNA-directed RNA polymerase subunit M/transcription elongation factor TFIIS